MTNEILRLRKEQLHWSKRLGEVSKENPEEPFTSFEEYYILMMLGKRIFQLEKEEEHRKEFDRQWQLALKAMEDDHDVLKELAK